MPRFNFFNFLQTTIFFLFIILASEAWKQQVRVRLFPVKTVVMAFRNFKSISSQIIVRHGAVLLFSDGTLWVDFFLMFHMNTFLCLWHSFSILAVFPAQPPSFFYRIPLLFLSYSPPFSIAFPSFFYRIPILFLSYSPPFFLSIFSFKWFISLLDIPLVCV